MRPVPLLRGVVRDRAVAVLLAVAVIGALACAGLGWRWWAVAHSEPATTAAARDAAVAEGTRALDVLHTIDHRTAAADLDAWARATSGPLHGRLTGDRKRHIERARAGETVASATVTRAALSELDVAEGTARMLAVVDTDVGDERRRSTLIASLTRKDGRWTVSNVQAVGS
ncbi:Mce-associated membrane protein [Prauserella isguenensis]|uniref:Mce-associated membrane protein n=1 Tax=Prauserella isguenensis TaxID=1470180 RepID=A0A839S4K0_9PSEU|nr:hypothetical protein [Prauserella isguenensis]MBB3052668.1 Mce-associated membrane protein [Prauserella isguenensis]